LERENGNIERVDTTDLDQMPRWLRDFIEYSQESAGLETGRISRFSSPEERENRRTGNSKEQRRFNELLRMLLLNPVYAQLYFEAVETVERLDLAADRARQKLERESAEITEHLKKLKMKAAELPDGRKVFRAKDGRLIAEDGVDINANKDSVTGLSPATPSWEEFHKAQDRLKEIDRQQREIDDYERDVIEPFKARLADTDNPPSEDELREFQQAAKALPAPMRIELGEHLDSRKDAKASTSAADAYMGSAELAAPDLFKQFSAASSVVADDAFAPPTREPYGSQATALPATPKT
jgi:hypothetical protein